MAALTPDAAKPEAVFAVAFQGLTHRRYAFLDAPFVNNSDTFDTGSRLVHTAWEPFATNQSIAAAINGAVGTSVVIFFTSGTNRRGWLHTWSLG